MRKLIWLSVLAVFVAIVSFLCLCLVKLDQQKEDNARLMLEENGKHQDHIYFGEDDPFCPGCHYFMWRFNTRFHENEELMEEGKKKERQEQERLKRIEENR